MNCTEFNRMFAELDDQSALPPALQEHRHSCAACAALLEDFALIARQAHVLRPMQAPSDRVWQSIQATLIAEGVIHSDPAGSGVAAIGGQLKAMPPPSTRRAPMGLAYAAMFLVALGVMYVHSLFSGAGAPPVLAFRPMPPAIPMRDAVTSSSNPNPVLALAQQAKQQLADTNVNDVVQRVPEEHRATFVSSLNQENESIQQLVDVAEDFPDDPFIQMQLRNAMIRQRMLQETPSRWNQ
jgi:hypothetical protein